MDSEVIKVLGAILLLLPLFERLGLRRIVNRHVAPSGAEHDAGLVVLILCLNRLLAPRPLVHVETWLADTALPEVFQVVPDAFNSMTIVWRGRSMPWHPTWRPAGTN